MAPRPRPPAPERTEIEPVEIRHILGDTFILEISAQLRTISFRLAGTRLCGAYGRELKGLGYLAIWREEDNFEIAKAIAEPLSKTDRITMISTGGEGTGASRLTGDVAKIMAELPAVVETLSGVEIRRLIDAIPALRAATAESPKPKSKEG